MKQEWKRLGGALCFALVASGGLIAQDTPEVPTEIIHGITVKDPYRWMEDFASSEVANWTARETARTSGFVEGPELEAMKTRIFELANYDLRFAAKLRGDRLFYLKRPKGGLPNELWVKEGGQERRLLTSVQVPETDLGETYIGGKNFAGYHWPDRTGNMVAYGYTDGISREVRIRILDSNSGLHLEEELRDLDSGLASIVWRADGRGFYYRRAISVPVPGEDGERVRPLGLYYHALGKPQSEDIAIISQPDGDRTIYSPAITADGKYLVIGRRDGLSQANDYLLYRTDDLSEPAGELFAGLDSRFRYLGSNGDRLFFQTLHRAENGRVVYVDVSAPETLIEIIAERETPMLANSSVGGDIIGHASGHILIGYLKDGVPEVHVFDEGGSPRYVLDVPAGQTIWGGLQGGMNDHRVSISTLSALSPAVISSVDVRTGTITQEFSSPVDIDASDYLIERVFYPSRDGTRVPMYVARHKRTKLDGTNPALMYGYGMHNWVSFLFYQPHITHWLEMGGVYAMPAIRGGGEYGETWHQAGIRTNRQNAIDDFVWAGRWLIENGYTSAGKLAANGSSASGPLGGMATVRYGDVFAASTIDYPVADMVRAPLFGSGAFMTEEYGSLEDETEARSIIEQSPYHQAQEVACRIPTLVMVGEDDRVVLPFHGLKLAAALQDNQSCEQPILFRLMPETGHNYGGIPERIAVNASVQLMFLKRVLNF